MFSNEPEIVIEISTPGLNATQQKDPLSYSLQFMRKILGSKKLPDHHGEQRHSTTIGHQKSSTGTQQIMLFDPPTRPYMKQGSFGKSPTKTFRKQCTLVEKHFAAEIYIPNFFRQKSCSPHRYPSGQVQEHKRYQHF